MKRKYVRINTLRERVETVGTRGRVFGLSGTGFCVVDRFIGITGTKVRSAMYSGLLSPHQFTMYYRDKERTRFVIACRVSSFALYRVN